MAQGGAMFNTKAGNFAVTTDIKQITQKIKDDPNLNNGKMNFDEASKIAKNQRQFG